MTYEQLMYLHLLTVIPCVFIGLSLFALPKGTGLHRKTGRVYVALMLVTSLVSLFMRARAGPIVIGHFGLIHSFSFLTLVSLPLAILAARRGNVTVHKTMMLLAFIGAIGVAGILTLMPDRYFYRLLFYS